MCVKELLNGFTAGGEMGGGPVPSNRLKIKICGKR
jgi:hypothetical protein